MKIGDLVRLSAYGMQRRRTDWVHPSDVGIIVEIRSWPYHEDYLVKWCRSDYKNRNTGHFWLHEKHNQRRDLRYAK